MTFLLCGTQKEMHTTAQASLFHSIEADSDVFQSIKTYMSIYSS